MESHFRTLLIYELPNGRLPFVEWRQSIADQRIRAIVSARLNRVALGLLGDRRSLGDGVWELRIDAGPGFRVYYGEWQDYSVILLTGGTKRKQQNDIKKAREYFEDFKKRNGQAGRQVKR